MDKLLTCPQCGRKFTPWRGKRFCSENCRKGAENQRLRGDETLEATMVADSQNPDFKAQRKQYVKRGLRGDERFVWTACNEVTQKLIKEGSTAATGFAMMVAGKGWFGRVRDDRGEWSFGPSTLSRSKQAVEAWLMHAPFDCQDEERMWAGSAWDIVVASSRALKSIHENV
jgi:hypothetical protein